MPTDETTLARLAEIWEERARRFAASAEDSESSSDIERYRAAPLYHRAAAEARLIADALRCKIASLTAPARAGGGMRWNPLPRALWAAMSPFVWAAHRLGWCSYAWVNVCAGARKPGRSFDALWHWRWFGDCIPYLPSSVTLHGIAYETSASEGTVVFVEDFTRRRIVFARYPGDLVQWQVTAKDVPALHVTLAAEWVEAVFGGTFEERPAAALPRGGADV